MKKRLLAITRGDQWNVLLRGHYGYGKTELAFCIAKTIGMHTYQSARSNPIIMPQADVHIIDECHLLHNSESLYSYMEGMKFLFCTNMASKLPEPFRNRCKVFRMEEYTPGQLKKIVFNHGLNKGVYLESKICNGIASISRGVPRSCVNLLEEYVAICEYYGMDHNKIVTLGEFFETLGYKNGLSIIERRYLEALSTIRSKKTLTNMLGIDGDDLDTIERFFLKEGIIEITPKGRRLV